MKQSWCRSRTPELLADRAVDRPGVRAPFCTADGARQRPFFRSGILTSSGAFFTLDRPIHIAPACICYGRVVLLQPTQLAAKVGSHACERL
jgi:hypothetical protein